MLQHLHTLPISATIPSSEISLIFDPYNQDKKTAIIRCITNETIQTSIFSIPINDIKIFKFQFLFQIASAYLKSLP